MLFERLRAETRDLHEQIERQLPVLQADLTLATYQALLGRYLDFYTPVEQRLERLRSAGLSLFTDDRRKCPLLLHDLQQWAPLAPLPLPCKSLPSLKSVSQGIGCMYVLEGSTLGGQLISRQLKHKLGITPENGGSFFASYGTDVSRRWKEFQAGVSSHSVAQSEADQIVDAARETFRCFDLCLGIHGRAE